MFPKMGFKSFIVKPFAKKIARDIGIFGLISAVIIFVVLTIRLLIDEADNGW